jgi:putative colanic acid biosynthesis acetyltransferase WcaF
MVLKDDTIAVLMVNLESKFRVYQQSKMGETPWSERERFLMLLWDLCWALFCIWTPKPLNKWRLFWLKLFGCKIDGMPFVHQRARIAVPWNLVLRDRACLGDRTNAYSLGVIEINNEATIAQEAYLCSATHDFSDGNTPLATAKITIGENVFIGARAFVMPGINIGDGAVIGACSIVTQDIAPNVICAGNPCRPIKPRIIRTS